jgi:lipoprotein-anchoring transpeptidase ErfK/SrfK
MAACTTTGVTPPARVAGPADVASPVANVVTVHLAATQSFASPATLSVSGGQLASVMVIDLGTHGPLPGRVVGTRWTATTPSRAGAHYQVALLVTDNTGTSRSLTRSFAVTNPPSSDLVHYYVTPGSGTTVGVSAPLVIRFTRDITDRADVERALTVYSTTPVVGAWHWIGSREVHFRPRTSWPVHSQIRLVAALAGVRAGTQLWVNRDQTVDLQVGDAHKTIVNGKTHTLTVIINGRTTYVWPTSLGRPEFVTRSGSYIVLEKKPVVEMTSCSASITCDKTNPNFYDLKVMWDTRLTWSGTFIHAAPWSVAHQGVANVSHGCINLSTARGKTYYDLAQYGDLVVVTGTSRGPDDLLADGDPGMADWNLGWSAWVAGSALGAPVTTKPLPAG